MMRKYIERSVFVVLFLLGVYLLFMPTLHYVYGLERASYHEDVADQFAEIEEFEIVHYNNSSTLAVALINEVYLGGMLAIDSQGEIKFTIKNFPDYKVSFNKIYYDSKDLLWVLPDAYYNPPYGYNVPWIYIINASTGNVVKKVGTNESYRGNAVCMHNDTAYIAFDNSGFRASFGFVQNYVLNTTVELDYDIGMVEGYLCLNDSMITLHHDAIVRYYYNNPENITFILEENENTMYSITWDEKFTLYYTEDKKVNDSTVSDIRVFNLFTNESDVIETGLSIHDIVYDDGLLYISDSDFDFYVYNLSTNTYYKKLESIGRYPSIHKLNDNFMLIGNYLLNKEENMLYRINISKCCGGATMIQ